MLCLLQRETAIFEELLVPIDIYLFIYFYIFYLITL